MSFGSYSFYEQPRVGYICCFSLKNPSHPEFVLEAACGVMCLDIHPHYPQVRVILSLVHHQVMQMVAAGLADGNIAVYDLTCKSGAPRLMSKVWKIRKWHKRHSV